MINIINAQDKFAATSSGEMPSNLRGIDMPAMQRPGGARRKSGLERYHFRGISGCFACLGPIALQHFRQYNQTASVNIAFAFKNFGSVSV